MSHWSDSDRAMGRQIAGVMRHLGDKCLRNLANRLWNSALQLLINHMNKRSTTRGLLLFERN